MDHVFDSEESSSGCESGWTLYLDHSIAYNDNACNNALVAHEYDHQDHDEYEDDDMSMVSDASSGPPHFQEQQEQDDDDEHDNNEDDTSMFGSRKRRKILKQTSLYGHMHMQDLPVSLDDTASSPFLSFYDVSVYFVLLFSYSVGRSTFVS